MRIRDFFQGRSAKCILGFALLIYASLFLSISIFHQELVQNYLWEWDPQVNSYKLDYPSAEDTSPTPIPVDYTTDQVVVYNRPNSNTNYSVTATNTSGNADSATLTLENLDQYKSVMYAQISMMSPGGRRSAYVRNGFVYVIRHGTYPLSSESVVSYPSSSLWRYDGSGKGMQILDGVAGQFILSRWGDYAAFYDPITESLSSYDLETSHQTRVLSLGDTFFKVFDPVHVGSNWSFALLGWDYWNKIVWGTFTKDGKSTGEIISFDTTKEIEPIKIYTLAEIQNADPSELEISDLYPYLVYSDFNMYGRSSGVHLYSLNLETKVKKMLYETSYFSNLSPVIVDNDAVSFYDPQKQGRARVKLTQ